jgi:spoIIIJ-associated protein
MSNKIEQAQQWLNQVLPQMGCETSVAISDTEDEYTESKWLLMDKTKLNAEQLQVFLEQDAKALNHLQYLMNITINVDVGPEEKEVFTIDLDNYRLNHRKQLFARATQVADQVRTTGKEITMEPMSGIDRRQVHHFFAKIDDLTTESRGYDHDRRLVVKPVAA